MKRKKKIPENIVSECSVKKSLKSILRRKEEWLRQVRAGENKHTTIMFKNIPSKINHDSMKEILAKKGFYEEGEKASYDNLRLVLDKVREGVERA